MGTPPSAALCDEASDEARWVKLTHDEVKQMPQGSTIGAWWGKTRTWVSEPGTQQAFRKPVV